MPGPLKVLAAAALLLSLACEPRAAAPVYGPWEEGLTLAFEDPSQPQPQRMSDRLQLRVAHSNQGPDKTLLVQLDLTSIITLEYKEHLQMGRHQEVDQEQLILLHHLTLRAPDLRQRLGIIIIMASPSDRPVVVLRFIIILGLEVLLFLQV